MTKITETQELILRCMPFDVFISPTKIAHLVFGQESHKHSAWASPICLRMVKAKLLKRSKKGHYKKVYY